MEKLQVKQTITDGILYALKNLIPLILMTLLWVITIWIPYLNVGTTIGVYKAVIKMGRGEVINPLDIFDKENRRNLGDFFILLGLMSIGTTAAAAFMFFPAIVLGIAWGFAAYFFLDKGLAPMKALKVSYKVTEGEKWTIFWIMVLVWVIFGIVGGIFFGLSGIKYVGWLFAIIGVAVYVLMIAAFLAVDGEQPFIGEDRPEIIYIEMDAGFFANLLHGFFREANRGIGVDGSPSARHPGRVDA